MKKDERLNFSDRTPSVRRLVVSLVLMLLAALPAAAQNKKITVDLDNVPVREFIKTVESQSGYTFAYNNSEIDLTRRVSVKAADENVVDVVIRALSAQNLTARMEGSRIVVSRKPAAARVQTAQPVRGGVVTGTVKTISGEPVIGASVIVLETNRGNVTGLEGDFSVEATPGQTLSVSFLGYNTQQIKVGSQTSFDITLTEDSKQISEVLVVGYTPMRKSDFTGSIASVKASELSATTPTVGQSLVGKVAGVEVHQTSGAPGDGVTIRVRGVNSLSASSAPLYVIDGYPASEDVFINPNDIESIDILKDAASAAIYGSRGASGVVLITTKRGKDGEAAKVSYDFSYGIQQLDHKVDLLNSTQFRDLLIDARNNSYRLRATAAGVSWSPYDDNTIRAAKGFSLAEVGIHPMCYDFTTRTPVTPQYDTDWQDELFSNAGIMRHNVSVIGGTKAIKYMASVGYMDQDGIIAPSNHNRINARINLDAQITKHLTASISYSMYDAKNTVVQAEGRMINDGVIQSALMYLPNLPAYEENGDYARSAMIRMKTDWGMNFPENPLAIANELDINEKMSRHNLNLNLVYEFLPDLKLSAFFIGCTTQSNAITETCHQVFSLPPATCAIITAFFVGLILMQGRKWIENVSIAIVPTMAIFFFGGCLLYLILHADYLLPSLKLIFSSAFALPPIGGGFAGYTMGKAIRYGVARGLFTNESGLGTTGLIAGHCSEDDSVKQAAISMSATFWDTVVLCAITGLVLVCYQLEFPSEWQTLPASALTTAAFGKLPFFGDEILSIAIISFALATLIGWSYLGKQGFDYLFQGKYERCYQTLYLIMIFAGGIMPLALVWEMTDFINLFLLLPNIYLLIRCRKYVKKE